MRWQHLTMACTLVVCSAAVVLFVQGASQPQHVPHVTLAPVTLPSETAALVEEPPIVSRAEAVAEELAGIIETPQLLRPPHYIGQRTPREFLAAYWGERWPQVEEWLDRSGAILSSKDWDFDTARTYEEVVPLAERSLVFGGFDATAESFVQAAVERAISSELSRSMATLEAAGQAYVRQRLYSFSELNDVFERTRGERDRVEELARRTADLEIELRSSAWDDGKWLLQPFVIYGPDQAAQALPPGSSSVAIVSGSLANFWEFHAEFDPSSDPKYMDSLHELAAAKQALASAEDEFLAQYGTSIHK